ncbi:MAG: hypothetical protein ACYCQI_02915 [Gammaproteobacteria bacterium]
MFRRSLIRQFNFNNLSFPRTHILGSFDNPLLLTVMNKYFDNKTDDVINLLSAHKVFPLRISSFQEANDWLNQIFEMLGNANLSPFAKIDKQEAVSIAKSLGIGTASKMPTFLANRNYDLIIPYQEGIQDPHFLNALHKNKLPTKVIFASPNTKEHVKAINTCMFHLRELHSMSKQQTELNIIPHTMPFKKDVTFVDQQVVLAESVTAKENLNLEMVAVMLHGSLPFWLQDKYKSELTKYAARQVVTLGDGVRPDDALQQCYKAIRQRFELLQPQVTHELNFKNQPR